LVHTVGALRVLGISRMRRAARSLRARTRLHRGAFLGSPSAPALLVGVVLAAQPRARACCSPACSGELSPPVVVVVASVGGRDAARRRSYLLGCEDSDAQDGEEDAERP
jgi:hypothetical protein